jgi:3-hydroxyacyl-[acyl-carrier-protein] dehydratase
VRFFHFDRVVSIELGKRIHTVKCVSLTDEFFRGHFPRRPLVPGSVWVEALVQSLGWLAVLTNQHKVLPLLSIVDEVEVAPDVGPGRLVDVHGELISTTPGGSMGRAWATLEGRTIASAGRVLYGHYPADPARLRAMLPDYGTPP